MFHVTFVDEHAREILFDGKFHHDVGAFGLGPHELRDFAHELPRVGLDRLHVHGPHGEKKIDHDLVETIYLLVHHAEVPIDDGCLHLALAVKGFLDQLHVYRNCAQGILDFVRDPGRQGRQRGQTLGASELRLFPTLFGDVFQMKEGTLYLAVRHERRDRSRDESGHSLGLEAELAVEHRIFVFEGGTQKFRQVLVFHALPERALRGIGTGEPEHPFRGLVVDDRKVRAIADDDPVEHRVEGGFHASVLFREVVEQRAHLLFVQPAYLPDGPLDESSHRRPPIS